MKDDAVLFADIAATSAAVTSTSGRRAKVSLLAGALKSLAATGDPAEIEAGAAYLAGEMRQRQIGVGWASLRDLPAPAEVATLGVSEVDRRFAELGNLSGSGSQARRRALVHSLFAAATAGEQKLLGGVISGEVRQGAQAGLLADAIAAAAEVPGTDVRRALLLSGDLKKVAVAALLDGQVGLAEFRLTIGRPLAPMLAQAASSIDEALAATGSPAAVDAKLDGIRIQVHRDGNDVGVFSRSLDDLTARVPEIVRLARSALPRQAVLDGEALVIGPDGRPRPFQETAGRALRFAPEAVKSGSLSSGSLKSGLAKPASPESGSLESGSLESGSLESLLGSESLKAEPLTLTPFFFDLLHLDGTDLVDEPGTVRWSALDDALPREFRVNRRIVDTAEDAQAAFAEALEHGQEGVVIKAARAAYDVGRRGSAWIKVKPRHTLDLVILAAEWGHGRRKGWLSNLHLGARDPAGGFVMLGKTFKGLTDAMLGWQTERLLGLAVDKGEWVVTVRPELVVEIAFDGVQASSRYPGGVTLRFARVLRYREDKVAAEADTLAAVRALSHAAHRMESPAAEQ